MYLSQSQDSLHARIEESVVNKPITGCLHPRIRQMLYLSQSQDSLHVMYLNQSEDRLDIRIQTQDVLMPITGQFTCQNR